MYRDAHLGLPIQPQDLFEISLSPLSLFDDLFGLGYCVDRFSNFRRLFTEILSAVRQTGVDSLSIAISDLMNNSTKSSA